MLARRPVYAFGVGALVGTLGGLIGLGGAEFRLPMLIAFFGFAALEAVILNKAASLVVVASALLFRSKTIPFAELVSHSSIILTLLSGSLIGAWLGASFATRLKGLTLYRIIAVCLLGIAAVLFTAHDVVEGSPLLTGTLQTIAGVTAGLVIGVVASLLGVAGGELLIPTIVLLFGADIKLAGSLSLAVSLPTMIVGFARYSRDDSFGVIRCNWAFVLWMAAGSIVGTLIGGLLLPFVSASILLPLLVVILLVSAFKLWRHV